eukprot:g6194.t1
MLLLGNEFNQIHFAHLEHHVDDELEDSANTEEYNPPEEEQEVEQQVQLEQEIHQDVQLAPEVEQEAQAHAHALHEAHQGNVLQAAENLPQQQANIVEGIAQGMVVVEEMPDVYGEQENVNPNIMNAPIAFVGIPFHEGVAIGVPQNQVVHVEEPPMLPPQPNDQLALIDIDNGGLEVEAEVEELEEFEIQVEEVDIDGDGDVVMMEAGVADEGVDVQEPQLGHRYPLRDTRARREYHQREQERRDRAGDRNEGGRRVRVEQPSGRKIKPNQSFNIGKKIACQESMSSGLHKFAKQTLRKFRQRSLENVSILQGLSENRELAVGSSDDADRAPRKYVFISGDDRCLFDEEFEDSDSETFDDETTTDEVWKRTNTIEQVKVLEDPKSHFEEWKQLAEASVNAETRGLTWAKTGLQATRSILTRAPLNQLTLHSFNADVVRRQLKICLDKFLDPYESPSVEEISIFSKLLKEELEEKLGAATVVCLEFEVSSPVAERQVRIPFELRRSQRLPIKVI